MSAATASYNSPQQAGILIEGLPVKASTKVYVGTIAAIDSSGRVVPASDTAGLKVLGRCEGTVGPGLTGQDGDNSSGSDGDVKVNVKRGVFRYDNSSGDPLAEGDVGKTCFVEDDHTVNKTGGTNKIRAGIVILVDSDGVWVEFTGRTLAAITTTVGAAVATTGSTTTTPYGYTTSAQADAIVTRLNQLRADVLALAAAINA